MFKLKHKWLMRIGMVVLLLAIVLMIVGFVPYLRSRVVMGIVTWVESEKVVGREEGITIQLVSPDQGEAVGLDWFSQMILFNQPGVSLSRLGLEGSGEIDLSIYYTFGHFEHGRSTIYDESSPYNSAFYGAYIIKLKPDEETMAPTVQQMTEAVTRFDYTSLILSQLGLDIQKAFFDPQVVETRSNVKLFNTDAWTMTDAIIHTRSVVHTPASFVLHDLQFGKPKTKKSEMDVSEMASQETDFPNIKLYGRTYAKYFEEKAIYVIFYVQSPSAELVEKTDQTLILESKLRLK